MNKILIILLGPTGIGKTDLSIQIAEQLDTEIISCDSRQFYSEMNIGTAVPSTEQLSRIRHHFIQHISIETFYSSSLFEKDVISLCNRFFEYNDMLIMTGGSGMYIDAVCKGIDDIPDTDPEIRQKYQKKYQEEGIESIRADLRILDPDHYRLVDLRNPKRILRALEVYETTGRPYSSFLQGNKNPRDFNILKIGLQRSREELYSRINDRVDLMMKMGLKDEVKKLLPFRNLNALNTVGYKELFKYFDQDVSLDKAIELIKRNSRRYAKRQITWWARDKEINWFHPDDMDGIMKVVRGEG